MLGRGTREDFFHDVLLGKIGIQDQEAEHLLEMARMHGHRALSEYRNNYHGGQMDEEDEGSLRRITENFDGEDLERPRYLNVPRRLQALRNKVVHRPRYGYPGRPQDFLRYRGRPAPEKEEAPALVKARYGKWIKELEGKPELSQQLHRLGASSLEAFGYEPPARFLDPPDEKYIEQCQTILEENLCEE